MEANQTHSGLTRQTYRRLVYAIIGVGILGLFAGFILDQHIAGTVIYLLGAWIGGAIAFITPKLSSAKLQDERDQELHNRASGLAMGISMVLGLSLIPALYVLDAGGYVNLSGAPGGAILTASALFLLYGVCFGVVQRRN